jgi:soluble lytic murein transglycosylase-like protein
MKLFVALFLISAATPACGPACADVYEFRTDGNLVAVGQTATRTVQRSSLEPRPARLQAPAATRRAVAPFYLQAHFSAASQQHEVSAALIDAVAWQESRYKQSAVSSKGARGVMQLIPPTARQLGVNPDDTAQNIQGGAAYLRAMLNRYDGDLLKALAAYNAGPGAVDRFGGIPPFKETRRYVEAILARLATQVKQEKAL